jgi:tRNA dimethylallyltransferase
MDIGSNKPGGKEGGYHLMDILSPTQPFSAVDYMREAERVVEDIIARGKMPLFVGGAGQYLSFLCGLSGTSAPAKDPILYQRILNELERRGDWEGTLAQIEKIDAAYAATMSANTWRRAARVLELYQRTGKPISAFKTVSNFAQDYDLRAFALRMTPRMDLLRLIDHRVELMLYAGLIAEVLDLLHSNQLIPDSSPAQAIGYRQVIDFLARRDFSRSAIKNLILEIMAKSRQLAHSQYAWFKKIPGLQWVDVNRWDMLPHGNDKVLTTLSNHIHMPLDKWEELISSTEWIATQNHLKQAMPKKQETKFYRTYRPILHIYNDDVPVKHGNPEVTILVNYLNSIRMPTVLANYKPPQKTPSDQEAPGF